MSYNTLNYTEPGGARTVVGGSLDVISGGDLDIESGASLKIAGTAITPTAAQFNFLAGVTAGTGAASKAVVLDASGDVTLPGVHTFTGATPLVFATAGTTRAIDIQITPTSADRQLYMDIDYGANAKEACYIIASSAKTSGETTAGRFRGQAKSAGAGTAEVRGVHAQGIAFEALYADTVNALHAEAIAKGTSTSTTIRGAMIACDSEGTPTAIGTMIGAHVRVKTSVAPSTAFKGMIVESEKFGSGVALTSFVDLATTTWTGGETVATDVITTANLTGTVTNIFNYSTTTCTSVFYSDCTATNFLEVSADSKGGAGATRATPNQTATCDGSIVCKIGAKTLLIPLYNAVTIA